MEIIQLIFTLILLGWILAGLYRVVKYVEDESKYGWLRSKDKIRQEEAERKRKEEEKKRDEELEREYIRNLPPDAREAYLLRREIFMSGKQTREMERERIIRDNRIRDFRNREGREPNSWEI
jgi:hypothetical protein